LPASGLSRRYLRRGGRCRGMTAPAEPAGVAGPAEPGAPGAGRLARRVPPLLRDRPFRRYWSAQTISMFGDQVSSIAMPLAAVLVLHASAAQMGFLTAAVWLPSLLFGV